MHRPVPTIALLSLALLGGCSDPASPPSAALPPSPEASASRSGDAKNYFAHLSGSAEVPANDSRAQGEIRLKLSGDGGILTYRLIVANLDNVHMAHLHLAPAGSNGGVVAWLYPENGPPPQLIAGRTQGVLAQGEITAASLRGTLAGQPLSALIDAVEAGLIYANVHSTDFPGGEVRGQVRAGG